MNAKLWIILMLVGLVLTGVGGALTQIASTGETKHILVKDVTLKIPGNVSLSMPLGVVEAQSRVQAMWLTTPAIQFTTVQTETGRPIEGSMGEPGRGTTRISDLCKLAPVTYDITEPLDLTVIVNIPAERDQPDPDNPYDSIAISYVSVDIFPPTAYPYTTVGASLAAGGIAILAAGVVARRRTGEGKA